MADPEDFLTRWSRRKREAKPAPETHPKNERAASDDTGRGESSQLQPARSGDTPQGGAAPAEIFDISKLPSLDSIGPATDIRMFMQPGVPQALSRAALRRAWSADPAIRDFIGLSENSWDFTASDGMHGFGALDPVEAKRLLAQLLGEADEKSEGTTGDIAERDAQSGTDAAAADASSHASAGTPAVEPHADDPDLQSEDTNPRVRDPVSRAAALQQNDAPQEIPAPVARRGHGRALPQ